MTNEIHDKNNLKNNSYAQVIDKLNRKQRKPKETQYRDSFKLCRVRPVKREKNGKNLASPGYTRVHQGITRPTIHPAGFVLAPFLGSAHAPLPYTG